MSTPYDAWNQEGTETLSVKKVKKDRLPDVVERFLRKSLAREDMEVFTLARARSLFGRLLEARPIQEQLEDCCALYVCKVGEFYEIKMVLIDRNNNPVSSTTKSYYGYELRAHYIDEMLTRFMDNQNLKIMPNPNR